MKTYGSTGKTWVKYYVFFVTNILQTFRKAKKPFFGELIISNLLFNLLKLNNELKIFFMDILIPLYKAKFQKR